MKLKTFDLVEISFLDSISNDGGWKNHKEFDWDGHLAALEHRVSGYVINQTKTSVSICQARAVKNDGKFTGVLTVPSGAITKLKKIKNGRK